MDGLNRADFTRSVPYMTETTTDRPSPALTLATEVLGEPVEDWVTRRRTLGQSWARMARDLAAATGGKCQFSRELLRRNFGHIPSEP